MEQKVKCDEFLEISIFFSFGLLMSISLHAELEVKTTIGEATAMGFQGGSKGLGVSQRTPGTSCMDISIVQYAVPQSSHTP